MGPIEVVVRRGSVVEARHRVHAVAWRDGAVVEQAGDPRLVSFLRSSSKPIQALPLVRARDDLDLRELAIACASHRAEPAQLDAVRRLLADAPARERELECGIQEGRPPDALHHNCSGKHAGMLALCRAHGWRSEGYRHGAHRVQRAMAAAHAEAAAVDEDSMPTAVDGCGVVTFALSLEQTAGAFSRVAGLPGGERIVGGDAGAPRAGRRGRPGRHRADAGAAGLDREGRSRGPDVRRRRRRARRRAEGRGRHPSPDEACAARVPRPTRPGARPTSSPGCRSETRTARTSEKSCAPREKTSSDS